MGGSAGWEFQSHITQISNTRASILSEASELGLGCMYSSPSARFWALRTFQAFGNSEKPTRDNALRGALAFE